MHVQRERFDEVHRVGRRQLALAWRHERRLPIGRPRVAAGMTSEIRKIARSVVLCLQRGDCWPLTVPQVEVSTRGDNDGGARRASAAAAERGLRQSQVSRIKRNFTQWRPPATPCPGLLSRLQ